MYVKQYDIILEFVELQLDACSVPQSTVAVVPRVDLIWTGSEQRRDGGPPSIFKRRDLEKTPSNPLVSLRFNDKIRGFPCLGKSPIKHSNSSDWWARNICIYIYMHASIHVICIYCIITISQHL